jgi:hypothetical protein
VASESATTCSQMANSVGSDDDGAHAHVTASDRRERVYFATYGGGFVGPEPALASDAGALAA